MIDTLLIRPLKYEIKDGSSISIQLPKVDINGERKGQDYPLFRTSKGETRGQKACFNSTHIHFDIKPEFKKIVSTVHFSVPAVIQDSFFNTGEVNRQELETSIEIAESELYDNGICASLKDADLSRIDIYKDAETERPLSEYTALFDLLHISRTNRREYTGRGKTYLFENTQKQICFYDKHEEMKIKAKKYKVPLPELTGNLIRCESRLLKKRKIESVLEFETVRGLLNDFDYISEFYREDLNRWIFGKPIAGTPIMFPPIIDYSKSKPIAEYEKELLTYLIHKCNFEKQYLQTLENAKGKVRRSFIDRAKDSVITTADASGKVESLFLELKAKLIGES